MSDSDYPAGAADDPRAPFNEQYIKTCTDCLGHQEYCSECGDAENCQCDEPDIRTCMTCDGSGEKPESQVEDEYESYKEDMKDE